MQKARVCYAAYSKVTVHVVITLKKKKTILLTQIYWKIRTRSMFFFCLISMMHASHSFNAKCVSLYFLCHVKRDHEIIKGTSMENCRLLLNNPFHKSNPPRIWHVKESLTWQTGLNINLNLLSCSQTRTNTLLWAKHKNHSFSTIGGRPCLGMGKHWNLWYKKKVQ